MAVGLVLTAVVLTRPSTPSCHTDTVLKRPRRLKLIPTRYTDTDVNLSTKLKIIPPCYTDTFVNLPTELKLKILRQMPDVDSLVALVMASPHFYRCYKLVPEGICTAATLRDLRSRGIVFKTPTGFLDVTLRDGQAPSDLLHEAMRILFDQLTMESHFI